MTKMACGQRQKPGVRDPQAHKDLHPFSDLNNYPSVVCDAIVGLSFLGNGQPLGLIGYDPKS